MTVIQRAKFMDKFMTGFFYVVAGFLIIIVGFYFICNY